MVIAFLVSEIILLIILIISHIIGIKTLSYPCNTIGEIEKITKINHGFNTITYCLTVKYIVDGEIYRNSHMKIPAHSFDYKPYQDIMVSYDKDKPAKSRVNGDNSYANSNSIWIVFIAVCITALLTPFFDSFVTSQLFQIISIAIIFLGLIFMIVFELLQIMHHKRHALIKLFLTIISIASIITFNYLTL